MPEPKTIRHWESRRYSFARLGDCPACSKPVEFWNTPAGNREILLDPQTYEPHFSHCARAREYRIEEKLKEGVL
jgi:hypothetical protein